MISAIAMCMLRMMSAVAMYHFYFARKEVEMKQAFITQQVTTGLEQLHIYTYTKKPYIPFPNIKKNL